MSQTLEQKRASYSYDCVDNIKNLPFAEKFKTLVKRTPTLILTNGLGNTLAFLFSKGKDEHIALAYIIGRYLFEENEYTRKIFGENNFEIFNSNSIDNFFNFIKDLYELSKIQSDYKGKKENNEKKEELKKNFNEKFGELKNKEIYSKYLNDNLKNKNIDTFKRNDYIAFLKLKMQNPIFQKLIFTDTDKYILATEETLRLLNWLKRFVEAMIEDEKEKKEEV